MREVAIIFLFVLVIILHIRQNVQRKLYDMLKQRIERLEQGETALDTMRKYKQIEEIVNAPIGGTSAKYNAIVNLIKYSEVNDGKNN